MTKQAPRTTSYTTITGAVVALQPVSTTAMALISRGMEKELRARGLPLDPPTYESEALTITGEHLRYPHTAETLDTDDPQETARNHAAWDAYEAARAELNRATIERSMEYILLEGVVQEIPEERSVWERRMRRLGVEVPEDPDDLKVLYLTTEVLRTPEDAREAAFAILRLSIQGTDPEKVAAAEALFRSHA
jgi:hypothetical protein